MKAARTSSPARRSEVELIWWRFSTWPVLPYHLAQLPASLNRSQRRLRPMNGSRPKEHFNAIAQVRFADDPAVPSFLRKSTWERSRKFRTARGSPFKELEELVMNVNTGVESKMRSSLQIYTVTDPNPFR
jgi:hypothetical protein